MDVKHMVSGLGGIILGLAMAFAASKGYDLSGACKPAQAAPAASAQVAK